MPRFSLPKLSRFSLISLLLIFILLILLAEGIYYWRLVKTQPYLGEMVATGRIEVFLSPGESNVGYFVTGQKFTPTGEQEGNWVQVIDSDDYELWIEKNNPYERVEK